MANVIWQNQVNLVIEIFTLIVALAKIYFEALQNLVVGQSRKDVRGQVVVITGGGHGLGRELALQLSKLGARLALIDLNAEGVIEVASEVTLAGGSAEPFVADVRDEVAVSTAIFKIVRQLGPIDILINNAGVVQCKPFMELNSSAIKRTFDVNVLGHFWTIRATLPQMQERGSGHIVAIASIAGLLGTPNLVDYCSSKHATIGLMTSLDRELHSEGHNEGIHLTTVCPLSMSTGMFKAPKTRFSSIFPVCTAEHVAQEAIDAILKQKDQVTIPATGELFCRLGNLAPTKAKNLLQDFFQYGVEPHS